MAYIEKTAFEPRITNNEYNELCNITGRYQVSDADADCSAGLLVVRGEQLPCAGFKGVKNENAFYMTAAGAAANADTGVYACNTYEWPTLGGRNGNNYAVGTATLGLGVPAGRDGTFTEIVLNKADITATLAKQKAILQAVMTDVKAPCWAPDPVKAGEPCVIK